MAEDGHTLAPGSSPAHAGSMHAQSAPGRHRQAVAERPEATQRVAVLVVDDQAPFRSAMRAVVGMVKGWRVVEEAGSGEEAVELAAQTRPDVVLMDINLPGINGIEATRAITGAAPGIRVVLLSTYAEDDLPEDARHCGAAGYIRKEDLTPRLLRTVASG
jgi:two-component system, NarL family, invasion response regulator UvrY